MLQETLPPTKDKTPQHTVTLCSLCAANADYIKGRGIGRITYADGNSIPAYLVEDVPTGRLVLEFDDDMRLPVAREQLDAFMAWYGLRFQQQLDE